MASSQIARVIDALKSKEIIFEDGLTNAEFEAVEKQYGFSFPPDLRESLSIGLPVSDDFPNWRTGKRSRGDRELPIADLIEWPAIGICFDVEHDGFWMKEWGPRPNNLQEAFKIARRGVKQAPPLIPVFSHCFLPAEPSLEGNPVMSVYQTDIIYYGLDLVSYLGNEFELPVRDHGNGTTSQGEFDFGVTLSTGPMGFSTLTENPNTT